MTFAQGIVMSATFVSGFALGMWFGAILWKRNSQAPVIREDK